MLNSKYAPIVALTVLGVLLVLGLGYMFGIKPRSQAAAELMDRESDVRDNITLIEQDTAAITAARDSLAQVEDVTPLIEVNAPSVDGVREFQQRVTEAIDASGSEAVEVGVSATGVVDFWTVSSALRPSTALATHFASAPLPRTAGDLNYQTPYAPVVTAPTDGAVSTDKLEFVTVVIKVKGTADEAARLISTLTTPEDRLFLVSQITTQAMSAKDSPLAGVSDFRDGDQVTTITGNVYVFNRTTDIEDEEGKGATPLPPTSPFEFPAKIDPQPGADK